MESNAAKRLFRFAVFEADEQTGELRKQGRRLSLQGQPLQVLLMLLERPGELVTRTEIQQRLWPEGTFVDFDHSLNTAVNKIRDSLGDSAASPRFIETLARRGYRFIAPVEAVDLSRTTALVSGEPGKVSPAPASVSHPPAQPAAPILQSIPAAEMTGATQAESEFPQGLLTGPNEIPQASPLLVRVLFVLLQVMYLCFYIISLARLGEVERIIRGMLPNTFWAVALLVVTAAVGIPTRLYLLSAVAFHAPGLREKFLRLFPVIFPLDELWALAPFLLAQEIGYGLAIGAAAALLYVPFAQRSLILMGAGAPARVGKPG